MLKHDIGKARMLNDVISDDFDDSDDNDKGTVVTTDGKTEASARSQVTPSGS